MQPFTIGKHHGGPLVDPHDECSTAIPSYYGEHVSPGKLKSPISAVNNTGLNDGLNVKDESKTPVGQRKHIFWKTSINNQ